MKYCLVATVLLALSCARGPSAAADGPKRVVFVLVDTLRYDHLGRAGDPRGLTPRLDALAAEGAWFPHALAASSWTRPSVTSMFTGLHPGSHGVEDGDDGLAPNLPTLAQLLAASGVNCLAVSANANGGRAFGLDRGFAEFRVPLERRGYPDDFEKIPGDVVMKKGLELLEQVGERESFFLFLHMIDPHDPYLEHPGLLGGDGPPGRFAGSRRDLKRLGTTDPAELTEDDYERIRWLYAGEVRFADQCVGELLDALAARGWLDDTLVIVTSDHGEELWNHGRRAHGQTLYQELVHVPLIVRPPPSLGLGGRTVERLAHHVDLMPTILSYFGLPAPLGIAGADLLPAVAGAALEPPAFVVSQLRHEGVTLECATDFRLKRILEPVAAAGVPREELYDLAADPGEHAPLQDPPAVRFAAVREFHAGMLARIARARVEGVTMPWAELGEDVRAELAGLGYAGD